MAKYLIWHDGKVYANRELYQCACTRGPADLLRKTRDGEVTVKTLFDRELFHVANGSLARAKELSPQCLDFDTAFSRIHVVLRGVEPFKEEFITSYGPLSKLLGACVLHVPVSFVDRVYKYRHTWFLPFRDFNPARSTKYHMIPHLPVVRVFQGWYTAVNAVNTETDHPYIVTFAEK